MWNGLNALTKREGYRGPLRRVGKAEWTYAQYPLVDRNIEG